VRSQQLFMYYFEALRGWKK